MPVSPDTPRGSGPSFAPWRIVTWLLLLLAAFGIFQYCVHAWHVAGLLHTAAWKSRHAELVRMLAWDIAYLVAACLAVACAAGALLRRGWARPALRVVAGVLAVWLLVTTIMLLARWSAFDHQATALMEGKKPGGMVREMVAQMRRQYLVAMVFKALSIPVLAWLSWRLGRPAVRAQFMPRRKR